MSEDKPHLTGQIIEGVKGLKAIDVSGKSQFEQIDGLFYCIGCLEEYNDSPQFPVINRAIDPTGPCKEHPNSQLIRVEDESEVLVPALVAEILAQRKRWTVGEKSTTTGEMGPGEPILVQLVAES